MRTEMWSGNLLGDIRFQIARRMWEDNIKVDRR